MKKIWVIPIEPIHTRYTKEWYDHIPMMIEQHAQSLNIAIDIIVVDGDQVPTVPTPGAFLDFGATNIWKSSQLGAIAEQFQQGNVKAGDVFLFTDAWNPTVLSVKYMSELLNIPVKIHGIHHAGSWDPQDFLGRLIGNKLWVRTTERAMVECYDNNWFASTFHMDMFVRELYGPFADETDFKEAKANLIGSKKIDLTGWPMDYLFDILEPYQNLTKKPQICFPHRLAPEKQLNIFKDLAKHMPEYEWIVCQEKSLTKHEYHTILGESAMVFSASLQETLGISVCAEGPICGAYPLVPDRLSYSELFKDFNEFVYPSEWTENWESYINNKDKLITKIRTLMSWMDDNWLKSRIKEYNDSTCKKYFSPQKLISNVLS